MDGDGLIAFYRYGYSSSPWKTFLEVSYGSETNVTVEIYFTHYWSQFKLQYGIVKQGLQSGELFFFLRIYFKVTCKVDREEAITDMRALEFLISYIWRSTTTK